MMVSPEHMNDQKPEEQIQSPVGMKKTRLLDAEGTPILMLLAIVVFVAAINFPSFTSFKEDNDSYFYLFWLLYGSVVAFVAGLLGGVVKPHWSLLFVPVPLLVGLIIGFFFVGSNVYGEMYFAVVAMFILIFSFVAFFGAVIGIPIGFWLRRKLTQ
jgi:hypothetical protein